MAENGCVLLEVQYNLFPAALGKCDVIQRLASSVQLPTSTAKPLVWTIGPVCAMTTEVPMKRVLALVLTTAFLCLGPARGWGQVPADDAQQRRKPRFKVMHMKNSQALLPAIRRQASSGNIIPLWNYSLVSPFDKLSYSGQMVGRSPFYHGYRSTVIQSYLIPVKLTFSDGTVLDPTTSNSCLGATTLSVVQNSPIFQTTDWIMNGVDVGTAQYIDAFQRANFWSDVSVAGNSYQQPGLEHAG
jgi:hypothetical protein